MFTEKGLGLLDNRLSRFFRRFKIFNNPKTFRCYNFHADRSYILRITEKKSVWTICVVSIEAKRVKQN